MPMILFVQSLQSFYSV